MKKISIIMISILIIGGIGGAYYHINKTIKASNNSGDLQNEEETVEETIEDANVSKDSDLSFVVLGDVHDKTSGLEDAIDDFYKLNKNIDALVLNGDTVDQGKDEQYDEINNVLEENKRKLPDNIIKNIGNHEFFDYSRNTNSVECMKDFMDKYLKFSGTEKVYHDTWIKDYHFISLGNDDLGDSQFGADNASLTNEQLSWFEDTLKQNYVKGKPIFVFLHQPISVIFYGNPWHGVRQENALLKILSRYPEVILFSSHTHKEFGDDYLQTDLNTTRIHTGAVGYTIVKDSTSDDGYRRDWSYNYGLYIEVKGNNVVVNGRDIVNHSWVFNKSIAK